MPLKKKLGLVELLRHEFSYSGRREDLLQIIEMTKSVLSPGESNADYIQSYLFFEGNFEEFFPPEISLSEKMNTYYCSFASYEEHLMDDGETLSGQYPDTPAALKNISHYHMKTMLKEIQKNKHPLPFTIIYQIGMCDNHVGIVAIRISSIENPAENEIMVINSLSGYSQWEDATISGLNDAFEDTAREKQTEPKILRITPKTTSGISQSDNACVWITAAMSVAIVPHKSFLSQKDDLVQHLRTLTGFDNEAALRRDCKKIISLPYLTEEGFNPEEVKTILSSCERYKLPGILLNRYAHKTVSPATGRYHLFSAFVPPESFENINPKYHGLRGDHLKTKILEDMQHLIEQTDSIDNLNLLKEHLMQSDEYKILKAGQGIFTRITHIATSSMIALEDMFTQQSDIIQKMNASKNIK